MNLNRFLPALLLVTLLFGLLAFSPARTLNAAPAAQVSDLIEISATAGYDGYYRPHQWMPVRVELVNNGDTVSGTLTIRPETSGDALTNAFLTPIDLPTNSSQVITLYVTARSGARELRVELLDNMERVLASHDIAVRSLIPHENMFVVLSGTAGGSVIDLAPISTGGNESYQATWTTGNIPTRRAAIDSVQAMVFNSVDTGVLTPSQRDAVADWVRRGGHLIVTGGATWQETAAGFEDLLPMVPDNAEEGDAMPALARFGGDYASELDGPFVVATGELTDDATVLVETAEGLPLMVRREYGNGTIDYLSVDPNAEPLRSWDKRDGMWLTLLASTGTRPNWSYDFSNWGSATTAVEIMPGVDLFPAVLGLIAFLALYVLLVGPLNYLLLNRINRRELAWLTIPILIIVFAMLARTFGADLRGSDITLSRLSMVQTWTDSEEAQVDQLIGLLAPRRGNYTLEVDETGLLRPIPAAIQNAGVFGGTAQNTAAITQTGRFAADSFAVDASFIAGFNATAEIARPDIGGSVVLTYPAAGFDSELGEDEPYAPIPQTVQGSVRNDSDFVLTDPVILARGGVLRLDGDLGPGTVRTFSGDRLLLSGENVPPPSPLEYAIGEDELDFFSVTSFARGSRINYQLTSSRTARDILGEENYDRTGVSVAFSDNFDEKEQRRRQAFLNGLIIDQYSSPARGDSVFLIGWADVAPIDQSLGGSTWTPIDTTLYIIELDVEVAPLPAAPVRVTQDQFTFFTLERENIGNAGSSNIQLFSEDSVTFRFTPQPGAILSEIEELVFILDQISNNYGELPIEFYDWASGEWQLIEITQNRTVLPNPERFIGPMNAVQVRVQRPQFGGAVTFEVVGIEQIGRF